MKDTRSEALQQAHETMVEEVDRSTKEMLREGLKTHELPEGSKALDGLESAGTQYRAKLTYDGGDFTADIHVELYDGGGNRVARFTAWGNTAGRGTFTVMGTAKLNYPIHVIAGWRFTYYFASDGRPGVTITWTGIHLEPIGSSLFESISVRGIGVGSGYIQVP